MMALLRPGVWGLAVGVLAVPVLIHLWSRRPARLVPIGSTRLLAGAKPSQARRLALTDLPLLALRLAILVAAGLALLGLSWRGGRSSPTRIALLAADADAPRRADSLAAAGWLVHALQPGLPPVATAAPGFDGVVPVWSLLQDAARTFPSADSVLVIAPTTAASLDGVRPAVPFGVRVAATDAPRPFPADTLLLCVENAAPGSVEAQRLLAALQSIGDAAARPARLLERPCEASRMPSLVLRAGAGMLGATGREPATGLWPLDPASLRDPAVIDALTLLLGVRDGERRGIVLNSDDAAPTITASAAHTTATSWHLPLSLAALLLLAFERFLAYRRSGATAA